jgi:hypothetical protein
MPKRRNFADECRSRRDQPAHSGLELHFPPTTVVTDHENKKVDEISLTQILDRTPFPLPENVQVPTTPLNPAVRTSILPLALERAFIIKRSEGRPIYRAQFWHYDPGYKGWYVYGNGQCQKTGNKLFLIPRFQFMSSVGDGGFGGNPPAKGEKCKDNPNCREGDPVSLQTDCLPTKRQI